MFIPKSINFSEMEREERHDNPDYKDASYNMGDNGLEIEKLEQDMHFEELVVQMLYSLEGNERIIFLYQMLRDYGYQIDHTSFAKTLRLKRSRYMDILGMVRLKTYLIVKGYKNGCSKQTDSK
jgi:hypothetical protein